MNNYIDSTNLKADATIEDITSLCMDAIKYHFATVCVNPYYVPLAKDLLEDSTTEVCTVVGFPLGMQTTEVKVYETINAIENGADEIDMVINIGALKDKEYDYVKNDIQAVKEACEDKAILKVIIETCLLTDEEKAKACELSVLAKADFVKTSTGFSKGGAKASDVKIMKDTVKDNAKVKASGGIHSYEEAQEMINAGADRLGTSATIAIVNGVK